MGRPRPPGKAERLTKGAKNNLSPYVSTRYGNFPPPGRCRLSWAVVGIRGYPPFPYRQGTYRRPTKRSALHLLCLATVQKEPQQSHRQIRQINVRQLPVVSF